MAMPHPPEAEHELCAAVFVDHRVLEDVADLVNSSDFYNSILRHVWEAMNKVVDRDGTFDFAMFREYLKHNRLWDRIGGDDTLIKLQDRSGSTANVSLYAREVREYARLRALIGESESIAAEAMAPGLEIAEFCETAEDRIRQAVSGRTIHRFTTPGAIAEQVVERATTSERDEATGSIPVGMPLLESVYSPGGLFRKLTVVAARPKMGKTNMGLQLALSMALRGHAGVFFSMEMTGAELGARALANLGHLDSKRIVGTRPMTDHDELSRLVTAADTFGSLPLVIDEQPRLTAHQIRARVGRAERELGRKVDWCVVDYFNIMSHPTARGRRTDEAMAVTSGALADLAKERDMVVLLLAQLSRKPEDRPDRRPIMSDLRECGALEQDAALIVSPFWPAWYWRTQKVKAYKDKDMGEAELIIMANRFGSTGSIPLAFWPEQHRYEERARSDDSYRVGRIQ